MEAPKLCVVQASMREEGNIRVCALSHQVQDKKMLRQIFGVTLTPNVLSALGPDAGERRKRYSELVAEGLKQEEIELFRRCARKGLPAGSDRYSEGDYVRQWVPELAKIPAEYIHRPWDAPTLELQMAGVGLGQNYPLPIIDHREGRERALAAVAVINGSSG